jgi:hypothetical protein
MARKFKLIKTYPGSPELGIIVEEEKCSSYSIYKATPVVTHSYPANWVENHPEFWEETVEEKAYEILSLICTRDVGALREGDKVALMCDKLFMGWGQYGCSIEFSKDGYDKSIWKPFTVKRLLDGVIFSVGGTYGEWMVEAFEAKDNDVIALVVGYTQDYSRQVSRRVSLHVLDKLKAPLFITEDGLDVHEGYTYTCVNTNCWTIFGQTAKEKTKLNKGTLAFNDKKLAEEYIWQNKPCLSFKEIAPVIGICNEGKYINLDKLTEKLKNIIQNKK